MVWKPRSIVTVPLILLALGAIIPVALAGRTAKADSTSFGPNEFVFTWSGTKSRPSHQVWRNAAKFAPSRRRERYLSAARHLTAVSANDRQMALPISEPRE